MGYGHAERNRIASQLAIAETIELLLRLQNLNEEQTQFVQKFAPEHLRARRPRDTCPEESALPEPTPQATPSPPLPMS